MSIRVHELAKKLGMENKDLISLLKARNYDVKTASSTVDNISAEALELEFPHAAAAPAPVVAPAPAAAAPAVELAKPHAKGPAGPMVKSADDVVRERSESAARIAAEAQASAAPPSASPTESASASRPPAPPSPGIAVSRPSAPPPLPVSAPPSISRPPAVPSISRPTSATTGPSAPFSAPRPNAPLVTPGLRPPSAPAPTPSVASAPLRPPVAAFTPPAFRSPGSPAPTAIPSRPPTASAPFSPPLPRPAAVAPKAPAPAVATGPGNPMLPVTPSAQTATITDEGGVKVIHLKPPIIVRDFATTLGLRPFKLISELMEFGIFASINQSIDEAVAAKVAEKHGFLLEIKHRGEAALQQVTPKEKEAARVKKQAEDEVVNLVVRPPVCCILGHVDHGKTSLLDAIRKANVAGGENGGITQHIGAYQIEHVGRKITFLDTPGHAAFNKMRARGASVTDIAILVVAADDGFMPQTDEALKHAQTAAVTLMVAVNKMDVKGANIERVKQQMQERNIAPEDWGGETVTVPVSALKGTGLSDLLDMILLQADVLELKANPKAEASGIIIESQVDIGRGPLATVLIQRGTLKVGDSLVCGPQWCKVRAMFNDKGETIKEAHPAAPVRVIGWSGAPDSGAQFKAVKNAREAENLAEEEAFALKKVTASSDSAPKNVSVEQLFADIAAVQSKILKVIIKTDVFGSTEAVRHVLEGIKSAKVTLEVVSTDVGLIGKNDVLMAGTGGAVIIGFNTKLETGVTPLAKHHGVRIETFGIIYELADKVKEMMADLLDPDLKEIKLGAAEVRATFPVGKGSVAGCLVTEGKITRNANARVRRKKDIVDEGKIDTLKRFKDDANEVRAGLECGIRLGDYNGYEVGDVIEVYEIQKVRASL